VRDELNTRALHVFEVAWPTVYRELSRTARIRWNSAPLGVTPQRRWRMTTTMRLLESPAPSDLERRLGVASACIQVDVQCTVRGVIEGWTISFRAFLDHDEVQALGVRSYVSRDTSPASVRDLLRLATADGPRYYPLDIKTRQSAAQHTSLGDHANYALSNQRSTEAASDGAFTA